MVNLNNELKVVTAPDAFKGSATTFEVSDYLENGIRRVSPNAVIDKVPIADGGEGTINALVKGLNGKFDYKNVTNPLGETVKAKYGILNNNSAVVEVAQTSGLPLIDEKKLNPMVATSRGLGELIKYIVQEKKINHIYVGLGGSATNDGGVGMAQALGGHFTDRYGNKVNVGASSLSMIQNVNLNKLKKLLKNVRIEVLSDVSNPLTGKNGATYVFGKQKGIHESEMEKIDSKMIHFQQIVSDKLDIDLNTIKGGGAAGGLGAALAGFCDAEIHSGINRILDILDFNKIIEDADLVVTGEGKMDEQSLKGKAPMGVAGRAKHLNKPVFAVVGSISDDISMIYNNSSLDVILDIINKPMSLDEAINNTKILIENASETLIRSYYTGFQQTFTSIGDTINLSDIRR